MKWGFISNRREIVKATFSVNTIHRYSEIMHLPHYFATICMIWWASVIKKGSVAPHQAHR